MTMWRAAADAVQRCRRRRSAAGRPERSDTFMALFVSAWYTSRLGGRSVAAQRLDVTAVLAGPTCVYVFSLIPLPVKRLIWRLTSERQVKKRLFVCLCAFCSEMLYL